MAGWRNGNGLSLSIGRRGGAAHRQLSAHRECDILVRARLAYELGQVAIAFRIATRNGSPEKSW